MLPASGPALSTRLCRTRQLDVALPPVRAASSDGSDRDSSDSSSTTTVDSGRPRGNTRPSAYSSDGGLTTEPGPATTEARRVDTSVLRWIHLMQDGEELNGSLSDKESLPYQPGRD